VKWRDKTIEACQTGVPYVFYFLQRNTKEMLKILWFILLIAAINTNQWLLVGLFLYLLIF